MKFNPITRSENVTQVLDLKDAPRYIQRLAEWHHHEWASLNPDRTLAQRIAYMQSYLSNELVPSTFIAKGNGLMGSAAIVANDMETKPELTPWLASVFVAPECRNQGIGSRLVTHVMQQARAAAISRLFLFTPDRVSFYRRLGWQILNEENYRGHNVTVMYVDLDATRF